MPAFVQAAGTLLPLELVCVRGARKGKRGDLKPKVGDQVMLLDEHGDEDIDEEGKSHGIHGVCTVTEDHGTTFALCIGPVVGGKQLAGEFWPQVLAVAKETGWMMLHYAVAQGCGQDVVAMVLHAHMEVSPRHTHPLWREGTRCTVGSVIVAERALLAKCSGT